MKTMISQKTRPRNSAGIPATASGTSRGSLRSTGPPPRDKGTAARRRRAGKRSRPGKTARQIAAGRRRSGPCPTRTASASLAWSCSEPGPHCAIIMPARDRDRHDQEQKDRREFRTHRSDAPEPDRPFPHLCEVFHKVCPKKTRTGSGINATEFDCLVKQVRRGPFDQCAGFGASRLVPERHGLWVSFRVFIVWNENPPSTSQ